MFYGTVMLTCCRYIFGRQLPSKTRARTSRIFRCDFAISSIEVVYARNVFILVVSGKLIPAIYTFARGTNIDMELTDKGS